MPEKSPVLPSVYLGNIDYFRILIAHDEIGIEVNEHFVKQTFRNRCCIYGANGLLKLVIPLKKWRNNTATKDIRIAYDQEWQKLHWRSLESAYRSSPYFEFYEYDFESFYLNQTFEFLIDFNEAIQETVLKLLEKTVVFKKTSEYNKNNGLLTQFNPKLFSAGPFDEYQQVFMEKNGFINNLSIIDLLFNLGSESKNYLKNQIAV